MVFFFKQKTAYEMRISDCSSDVCSSDLYHREPPRTRAVRALFFGGCRLCFCRSGNRRRRGEPPRLQEGDVQFSQHVVDRIDNRRGRGVGGAIARSEEHTSELQSLMRISYAVFCLQTTTLLFSIFFSYFFFLFLFFSFL